MKGTVVIQLTQAQPGSSMSAGGWKSNVKYYEPYDLKTVKLLVRELAESRIIGHPTRDKIAAGDFMCFTRCRECSAFTTKRFMCRKEFLYLGEVLLTWLSLTCDCSLFWVKLNRISHAVVQISQKSMRAPWRYIFSRTRL